MLSKSYTSVLEVRRDRKVQMTGERESERASERKEKRERVRVTEKGRVELEGERDSAECEPENTLMILPTRAMAATLNWHAIPTAKSLPPSTRPWMLAIPFSPN